MIPAESCTPDLFRTLSESIVRARPAAPIRARASCLARHECQAQPHSASRRFVVFGGHCTQL